MMAYVKYFCKKSFLYTHLQILTFNEPVLTTVLGSGLPQSCLLIDFFLNYDFLQLTFALIVVTQKEMLKY